MRLCQRNSMVLLLDIDRFIDFYVYYNYEQVEHQGTPMHSNFTKIHVVFSFTLNNI